MPTYDFIEFIASLEQFETAMQAQHWHGKLANAPEEVVKFVTPELQATESLAYFSCRYENFTFPGILGSDTVAMLHIIGPETNFFFAPALSLFFTRRQVVELL
jgi:hypothetical protein